MASLSKRALDYYAGLPPDLQTPATARNRALAEVRYAISLRNLGRLDEAAKAADSAVATLAKLRAEGDASEPTLIGLAMGTSAKGRIFSQQARFADARKEGKQAFELLRPAATAAGSSVAVRRAFGEVAVAHGFNAMRDGDYPESVAILDDARAALRSIDGLKLADLSSAALFVEATAWQMDSLTALRRGEEARKNGEEARAVANGVLREAAGSHDGPARPGPAAVQLRRPALRGAALQGGVAVLRSRGAGLRELRQGGSGQHHHLEQPRRATHGAGPVHGRCRPPARGPEALAGSDRRRRGRAE